MSPAVAPGRVSAVVASYNHARYLPKRMDSLIGQTYPHVDILVIDDCSPDNSREVLAAYRGAPRVTLIDRETNGGWVVVSNQGIELSRGEFILFANCDDFCTPDMIERLVAALDAHPTAGVAFCRSVMVDENDRVIGDDFVVREAAFRVRCASDVLLSGAEMRRFLMHSCVIPNLSAALIRRTCFDRVGVLSPEYRACSDWDIFFRIADHFDFFYVAAPLNSFRQHVRSIRSATKGRITYDEFFRVLLAQVHWPGFSAVERAKWRLHTMYLWSVELLQPSTSGLVNIPHHLRVVASLDPAALLFLPLALTQRALELPVKAVSRVFRTLSGKVGAALDPVEGPQFLAACRRSPQHVPAYAVTLAGLAWRRLMNTWKLRSRSSPHLGLKLEPEFLTSWPTAKIGSSAEQLASAPYALLGPTVGVASAPLTYPSDDPEAILAAHRWTSCVRAVLDDTLTAEEAAAEVSAWLGEPPPLSHAVWEPYSASERVANLAVLLAVAPRSGELIGQNRLLGFFIEHTRWISGRLEYYGPQRTNNHILNNARALVIAGCVLKDGVALGRGLALFARMLPDLVGPDGFLRERSSHYQIVIANWVLDAFHFARAAREAGLCSDDDLWPLSEAALRIAPATARLVKALMGCDGDMPIHIGDISPDLQPRMSVARLMRLYPDRFVLPQQAASWCDGSWAVAVHGQDALVTHVPGDYWPEAFTSHGHADLTSFVWLRDGNVVLADAGRASYRRSADVAEQTGPVGHNVVMIDGAGPLAQSVLRSGVWYPEPYARASVTLSAPAPDQFVVAHDGFARLGGINRHTRRVTLTEKGVLTVDNVGGSRSACVRTAWHLGPDFQPDKTHPARAISPDGRVLEIDFAASVGSQPCLTWGTYLLSSEYGRAEEAAVLVADWSVSLPCTFTAELTLTRR